MMCLSCARWQGVRRPLIGVELPFSHGVPSSVSPGQPLVENRSSGSRVPSSRRSVPLVGYPRAVRRATDDSRGSGWHGLVRDLGGRGQQPEENFPCSTISTSSQL